MKKYLIIAALLLVTHTNFSQVAGNINYLNNVYYPDNNIDFKFRNNEEIIFEVKGLSNIKADSYVAIFNVTQTGKTSEEANELLKNRIAAIQKYIKTKTNASIYIDMISFVPVYDYIIEKKLFSKNTYNEIPKGFELQKNIHIKYTNPEMLNEIINICSKSEIYDLVKVDYFINDLEKKKRELTEKALAIIKIKLGNYQEIIGVDFIDYKKKMIEGFTVKYPTEMYKKFEAYSNTSLKFKRTRRNEIKKATKLYYQPIVEKEFDFVINSSYIEPVIQLMYQIKIKVAPKTEETKRKERKQETKYILITPKGELKNLALIK